MSQPPPEKAPNIPEEDKNRDSQTAAGEELPHQKIDRTLKNLRKDMLAQNSLSDGKFGGKESALRRMLFSIPLFLVFWLFFWYFYLK